MSATVVPKPFAAGLTLPEMVTGCAAKLTAVASTFVKFTDRLAGVNVYPVFDGVTVENNAARGSDLIHIIGGYGDPSQGGGVYSSGGPQPK